MKNKYPKLDGLQTVTETYYICDGCEFVTTQKLSQNKVRYYCNHPIIDKTYCNASFLYIEDGPGVKIPSWCHRKPENLQDALDMIRSNHKKSNG